VYEIVVDGTRKPKRFVSWFGVLIKNLMSVSITQ